MYILHDQHLNFCTIFGFYLTRLRDIKNHQLNKGIKPFRMIAFQVLNKQGSKKK